MRGKIYNFVKIDYYYYYHNYWQIMFDQQDG